MNVTVVLENLKGKQIKIPLDQISPEDREYIELAHPPKFDINFMKKSSQVQNPPAPPWGSGIQRPLQMLDHNFGVQVRQKMVFKVYDHDLLVEYFAIGEEVDDDNYVLLERNQLAFNPAELNGDAFQFRGNDVRLRKMAYRDTTPMRGAKYGGFLVTLTDKHGKIVDYKTSHEFLFDNLANLRKIRPNFHFDRDCLEVIPARPTEDSRGFGAYEGR